MRARTAAAALGWVLVAAFATGCGGDDITIKTPDGTVKVDSDGQDFSLEGENGEKIEGGTSLPEDFPEEVALIDGKVVQAISATGDSGGFSVNLQTEGDPEAVFAEATDKLEDAGFVREGTQSYGGSQSTAILSNERWQVLVSVTSSGDGEALYVGYTVAAATS